MIKLAKQDREALDAVAAGHVVYVPGRERATGAPTKWSYQRYAPAAYGFKDWKRCTAPVNRLVEAGLAEHASVESRCTVTLTAEGEKLLAAETTTEGVTGRTAEPGDVCGRCVVTVPAVSTFMVDGKVFGHACERHIIDVHERAEKSAAAPAYERGTKLGRSNLTHLPIGARILVWRTMLSHTTGTSLAVATAKTDAIVATVTGKAKGGGFRCYTVTTDAGVLISTAITAVWVLEGGR
jgi:hypothetical protein